MARRMERPALKPGDIVENRAGKRRRYLGTFGYDGAEPVPSGNAALVAFTRLEHKGRSMTADYDMIRVSRLVPAHVDARVPPAEARFIGIMEHETWDRWIAGGRVVAEGGE
jgi:hypothetical protein